MACIRNDIQRLRLPRKLVSVFAELFGMHLITSNKQYQMWRNRLDVVEQIEVHELTDRAQHRFGCQFFLPSLRGITTVLSPVEIEEFTLNRRC